MGLLCAGEGAPMAIQHASWQLYSKGRTAVGRQGFSVAIDDDMGLCKCFTARVTAKPAQSLD